MPQIRQADGAAARVVFTTLHTVPCREVLPFRCAASRGQRRPPGHRRLGIEQTYLLFSSCLILVCSFRHLARCGSGPARRPSHGCDSSKTNRPGSLQPSPSGRGLVALAFVGANHTACRGAIMGSARSMLSGGRCRALTLVHCVPARQEALEGMLGPLRELAAAVQAETGVPTTAEVIRGQPDTPLHETLTEYACRQRPDLVILRCKSRALPAMPGGGSSGFSSVPSSPTKAAGLPPIGAFSSAAAVQGRPGHRGTAIRLAEEMALVPVSVLLAKGEYRTNRLGAAGTWMAAAPPLPPAPPSVAAAAGVPLSVMFDVTSTSRPMIEWAMRYVLSPRRDRVVLAAASAYERQGPCAGAMKATASRMLNIFGVQLQVNQYRPFTRAIKEAAPVGLPPLITEEKIDLFLTPAPRTKELPPALTALVYATSASVLLFREPSPGLGGASSSFAAAALRASVPALPITAVSLSRPTMSLPLPLPAAELHPRSSDGGPLGATSATAAEVDRLMMPDLVDLRVRSISGETGWFQQQQQQQQQQQKPRRLSQVEPEGGSY